MAALHGFQAESELFRRGECERDEEEEAYKDYQRRLRAAAKSKAHSQRSRGLPGPPPREPQAAASTQQILENEHADRLEARRRLEEREARVDAVCSSTLGEQPGRALNSEPVRVEDLREELKSNERAIHADTVQFVGAWK